MKRLGVLLVLSALVVAGCNRTAERLVGSWTLSTSRTSGVKNMADLGAALTTPGSLEFNKDGEFKAEVAILSVTGTYEVHGNEVVLTSGKGQPMTLILDGDKLRMKKSFESDPDLEYTKKTSG